MTFPVTTPIVLPWPLQSSLEVAVRALLEPSDGSQIDFSRPIGKAALVSMTGGVSKGVQSAMRWWPVGSRGTPCAPTCGMTLVEPPFEGSDYFDMIMRSGRPTGRAARRRRARIIIYRIEMSACLSPVIRTTGRPLSGFSRCPSPPWWRSRSGPWPARSSPAFALG